MIPFMIDMLEADSKGFERRMEELKIRGRIKTIKTTTLLRLARILRRVLETCHSDSCEKLLAKILQGV